MGEYTSIDVPSVTAMSESVRDVAERLERLGGGIDRLSESAADAVAGSVTGSQTMPNVSLSWRYALEGMGREVRGFADDLTRAAADYQRSDDDAAERVRTSGAGL
jgi:hypothetical protein